VYEKLEEEKFSGRVLPVNMCQIYTSPKEELEPAL
jgi:hypothetical protein